MLVGTAFYTALAKKIVFTALKNGCKVIEVNKDSALGRAKMLNNVVSLKGSSDIVLPSLLI